MASKIKTIKNSAPSISVLANISQAAFEAGGKVKALVALISEPYKRADTAGQTAIRDAFCFGDVAARLGVDLAKGQAIVKLPKADSKAADRKTKVQQQAYDASRQLFSRFLRDAGLTTASTANNAGKNAGRKPRITDGADDATTQPSAKAAKAEREAIIQSRTPSDARDTVRGFSVMMLAYQKKNAKIVSAAYASAIMGFKHALDAADKLADAPAQATVPTV